MRVSRRALLFVFLGTLVAVPLVALAARWASGRLSTQVWYVIWYADLLLDSVPQEIYWTLLVLLFVILAALSMIELRKARPVDDWRLRSAPAPVRELASLIGDIEEGYYYRWSLSQELSGLVVDAVEGERPGPSELRRRWFVEERAGVPAQIQAYVKEAIWGSSVVEGPGASLWRRLIFRQRPESPLGIDPVAIVDYVEEQLEVANDRRRS